jgi:replicative DNA helicase
MTREEAINYIRRNATTLLIPDKSKRGYICPICASGSGKNGTGITTKDKVHFTCWSGCFTSADIFDIIALQYGIDKSDFNEQS